MRKKRKLLAIGHIISKVAGVNIILTQAERRRARKRYVKWRKKK